MQDVNEILVECVKALGGSKVVGAKLFPDLLVDKAQRKLLDCLNPDRDHKLSPEQAHLIMRWSHDAGYHDGWYAYCDLSGYGRSEAIKPKDEQAELQRKFVAAVANMQAIAKQLGGGRMIHNAFSPHYVPQIKLKPNWKDTQLANLAAKDREALALKTNPSAYITIGTQADTDKRRKMSKARI